MRLSVVNKPVRNNSGIEIWGVICNGELGTHRLRCTLLPRDQEGKPLEQQSLKRFSAHKVPTSHPVKQEFNMLWAKEACSKSHRITIFKTVGGAIAVWWQELYPWHPAWVPWRSLPTHAERSAADLARPVDQLELSVPVLDWFLITVRVD